MARAQLDAERLQPPQPGAEQRRRLEAARKNPPARTDERRLAERGAPSAQGVRREGLDCRAQTLARRPVAREETIQRLRMGEIEPAAAGEQKFARRGGGGVGDDDFAARFGERLRRHQTRGARADDECGQESRNERIEIEPMSNDVVKKLNSSFSSATPSGNITGRKCSGEGCASRATREAPSAAATPAASRASIRLAISASNACAQSNAGAPGANAARLCTRLPLPITSTPFSRNGFSARARSRCALGARLRSSESWNTGMSALGNIWISTDQAPWSRPHCVSVSRWLDRTSSIAACAASGAPGAGYCWA